MFIQNSINKSILVYFWSWNHLNICYVILTWRDGSNETVRSSRCRSRCRIQYILKFWILNFGTPLKFQFSSITSFFHPKFPNPYRHRKRKCVWKTRNMASWPERAPVFPTDGDEDMPHFRYRLRSIFRLWDSNLRTLRSKIWTRKIQKPVLRSQIGLLRGFPRPKNI